MNAQSLKKALVPFGAAAMLFGAVQLLPAGTSYAQDGSGAEAEAGGGGTAQELYTAECRRCHGDDGQADTGMGRRFEVVAWTEAGLAELGADGIRDAIVSGRENMDPLDVEVTEEQMTALVEYVISLGAGH